MTMWPDARPTTDSTVEAGASAPPVPPRPVTRTREYRAQVTFALAAVFITVVVLRLGSVERFAPAPSVLPAALLGIAVNVVAAWGLPAGRPWARYAMTPLLWIDVGAGVLTFLVALSGNALDIPIVGVVAAWALTARPSEALGPVPASSTEGTLLILGAIVAAVIGFL
jgi:hypothetical protein